MPLIRRRLLILNTHNIPLTRLRIILYQIILRRITLLILSTLNNPGDLSVLS
ncbi:hypothetical protein HZA43_04870 [Candidatus Peregrinibacteria bacterium]|nr:hypothetical protein [Candidatus Peregrinibacteria bacterium]